MKSGIELIQAERERQISQEGWTAKHDDEHNGGELGRAGESYEMNALAVLDPPRGPVCHPPLQWPWKDWGGDNWWKPSTPVRDLVKAGALYLAEAARCKRSGSAALAFRRIAMECNAERCARYIDWHINTRQGID